MKLRLLLIVSTLLLWQCRALVWLYEKVRSRMAARQLIQAQGEIEATIRNVRMWMENDPGWYRRR